MFLRYLVYCILCSFLLSCNDRYKEIANCNVIAGKQGPNQDTLIIDSISTTSFARLWKANTSGLICYNAIPKEHSTSRYNIVFNGIARTNYAHSNACIILGTSDEDGKVINYIVHPLRYHFVNINAWCAFKDSIFIPYENWNKPYTNFSTYAFLASSEKENFDMQYLNVTVKSLKD